MSARRIAAAVMLLGLATLLLFAAAGFAVAAVYLWLASALGAAGAAAVMAGLLVAGSALVLWRLRVQPGPLAGEVSPAWPVGFIRSHPLECAAAALAAGVAVGTSNQDGVRVLRDVVTLRRLITSWASP